MYHVFCHIYFDLGNVSSCIDMFLGIFVNRIEVEVKVPFATELSRR